MPPSLTADEWNRETAWVARLARSLVADPHTADDVAQDAWLATMHTDTVPGGFRAWMSAVVRNAARMRARSERRRHRREAEAPALQAESAADPTATAALRLEVQARLLAAVHALDEAQRTAIVLRYFEGRSPRTIAADLGVPVRTVHTRLHRALARLRTHLDREHGDDRRAWLLPLSALASPPRPLLLTTLLMKGKLTLAAGVLALAGLATKVVLDERVPRDDGAPTDSTSASLAAANPAPTTLTDTTPSQRQPLAAAATAPARPERSDASSLSGLVVDERGTPQANVAVQFVSMFDETALLAAPLRTDAAGRFAGRAQTPLRVRVVDPDWASVLEPQIFEAHDEPDLTVVVAPALAVAGMVVDGAGTPIANALVSLDPTRDLRALPGRRLDRCSDACRWTRSDAAGHFAFTRAPRFDGGRLNALAEGFRQYGGPAPQASTSTLQIVLERDGELLDGRVVDRDDQPVADAVVVLGGTWARTQADGSFRLGLASAPTGSERCEVRALQPGRLSARVRSHAGQDPRRRAAWPSPLVLRTGGAPLAIRGRVVRFDGTPVAHVRVTLLPGYQPIPDSIEFGEGSLSMGQISGDADDARGEFAVCGLDPGSYRLRVLDPATHQAMVTAPLVAGSDEVEVRLPDAGTWPALAGGVVDRRGRAVAGADWSFDGPAPSDYGEERVGGPFGHADTEGRIAGPALSRAIDTLLVKGPGMADWERVPLADLREPGRFRVVVPIGCQAQIVLADGGGADSATFVDSKGRDVPVVVTHGDTAWGQREVGFTDGATQTFMAPDDLVEVVLKKEGHEVRRVPVSLELGELNVLRL